MDDTTMQFKCRTLAIFSHFSRPPFLLHKISIDFSPNSFKTFLFQPYINPYQIKMAPRRSKSTNQEEDSHFALGSQMEVPTHQNRIMYRGGEERNRVISICSSIDFNNLSGIDVVEDLKFLGWENYLKLNIHVNFGAVGWFYKHVQFRFHEDRSGNKIATMFVDCGDERFVYGPEEFLEDFGLESAGYNNFEVNVWPEREIQCPDMFTLLERIHDQPAPATKPETPWAKCLNGNRKFLLRILRDCMILHTTRQDQNLSPLEAILIELIQMRTEINLPYIVTMHIATVLNRTSLSTLPMGILITHIMKKWKIGKLRYRKKEANVIISRKSFRGHLIDVNGVLVKKQDMEVEADPEEEGEPQGDENMGDQNQAGGSGTSEYFNLPQGYLRFEERLNNVEAQGARIYQEVHDFRHETGLRFQQMEQNIDLGFQQMSQSLMTGLQQMNQDLINRQMQANQRAERQERNWARFVRHWGPMIDCPEDILASFENFGLDPSTNPDAPGSSHP